MLHTKFQESEPSGSEAEHFIIYFYACIWFDLNKSSKGLLGNATYQISRPEPRGSEGENS